MKEPRKESKLYELSFQVEDISEKKTPLSELYEVNVQVEDVFEQKTLLCKLMCSRRRPNCLRVRCRSLGMRMRYSRNYILAR